MGAVSYAFSEAWSSLWRGGRSTLLSVITIMSALLVTGLFLLITINLDRLVDSWGSAAEMAVYLRDTATPEERAVVEQQLRASGAVATLEFVTKEQAFARFRRDFSDLASVATALGDNPFPASFDVQLRPERAASAEVDGLALRLGAAPGVEDVRYDRRWLERLTTASTLVRGVGAAFAFMLILAASLSVANVVRLSCHARRTELEIMHLVGAPLSFVRGPFIAEGILQGALGALVALAALAVGFVLLPLRLGQVTASFGTDAIVFLSPSLIGALIVGGMIVGCLGGVLGVRSARTSPTVATRDREKTETIELEDD